MKKKFTVILILTLSLLLTACGHTHTWQAATCTSPKICPECGEVEGESLGHTWLDATCTDAKVCTVCLQTMGSPLGHNWEEATCITSKICTTCGITEGDPLGHTWIAATCVDPEVCESCGEIQGAALGHTVDAWNIITDSTCTELGKESGSCSVCGETLEQEISLKDHTPGNWTVTEQPTPDKDGTHVKYCTVCDTELESETFSLTPEEIEKLYKSNCKTISYDKLSRSPGDYEEALVKFSGRVVQVCSEAKSAFYYSTYRVAVNGSYNSVVYIYVDNYGSNTRILEDDWITFYGEFDGLYTYETVMGASVTIPSVKVEYIG